MFSCVRQYIPPSIIVDPSCTLLPSRIPKHTLPLFYKIGSLVYQTLEHYTIKFDVKGLKIRTLMIK
jgi:hypothetical protein